MAAVSEEEKKKAAEGKAESPEKSSGQSREDLKGGQDKEKSGRFEEAKDEKQKAKEDKSEKTGKKDAKDEQIEQMKDQLMRQMAEFDNFRKRSEKEKSAMFDMGAIEVIKKLLPIVDNFERGFAQLTDEEKKMPFATGMEKVYRQMVKMLTDLGVKPIEAVGKEFDPDLHNAVLHCEDDSVGANTVVEELEKGYTYHDTVVRYSMVKVAN